MRTAAWLLVVAGCYAPTVTPGAPCGAGDACPRELECRAGRCELPGVPADVKADGPGDGPVIDDVLADGASCPEGYAMLAGAPSCYRAVVTMVTWPDAQADCVATGGFLAIPNDDAERAALFAISGPTTWLGISDLDAEGTFVTVLGAPAVYLPWSAGEPNNGDGDQDCVQFYPADEFDDELCTRLKQYVCEAVP